MLKMDVALVVSSAVFLSFAGSMPAHAQVSTSGYILPMRLALQGAAEAVRVCEEKGYSVTATVVDVSGTPQVMLRGDHSTIHTKDSAFRKAYTAVTMGPVFNLDSTSAILGLLSKYPPLAAQALASTPNVAVLPGGVAIKLRDEVIGAIGVGGSPGGDKDESCARAGASAIEKNLPH